MSGTSSVQLRNTEMLDILSTDFPRRNETAFAWGNATSMFLMLPGLRGFWPMSSGDETGAAYDLSGQGRTLTYNGNPTYNLAGLVPYLDFDGTGDYLSRADEAGLSITGTETVVAAALNGLTVGGWFRFDAIGSLETLVSKWVEAGNQRAFRLSKTAADVVELSVSVDGAAVATHTATGAITATTWKFIVGRFTPSTELATFVNGTKEVTLAANPASIADTTAAFEVGRLGTAANYLSGFASLVFLCAAALPDRVVQALYHHTKYLFPPVGP